MTRRLLLQGLVGLWSEMIAVTLRLTDIVRAVGSGEASAQPSTDAPTLTAAEMDTLVAFGEVLVEGRTLPPTERGYLVAHIDESVRTRPDRLALYRTTTRLLDRLAGGRFALLGIRDRVELISRHRLNARGVISDEDSTRSGPDEHAVRARAVPDLINGYWRSPAGWAAVDYAIFPGRCGELARYTHSEA